MCGLCGARDIHDDVIASIAIPDRSESYTRARVAAAATQAFASLRITVRSWSGRFIVSSPTGRSLVVDRFSDVVAAASTIAHRPLDPLDIGPQLAPSQSKER